MPSMLSRSFTRNWALALTLVLCIARHAFASPTNMKEDHSGWSEDMDLSDGSSATGSARWNTFVNTVTDEQNRSEPEFEAQHALGRMHLMDTVAGTAERASKRPRWSKAQPDSSTISNIRLPSLHGLPLDIIGSHLGARDHAMLSTTNRNFAEFTRSHPRRQMIEYMRTNLHNPAVVAEVVRDGTEVDVADVLEMLEERGWREGTHGYWNLDPLLLAVRHPLDRVLPLVSAIRQGSADVAYQLIAAGAPFHQNTIPVIGDTSLETPCEAARALKSAKMYNKMSRVGCLLLSVAADQEETVEYLLRHFPELVNARDIHGRTSLHLAGTLSMTQLLVEKFDADVNVHDSVDESPLTYAIIRNDLASVRYLLDRAAVADPQFASRVPLITSVVLRADPAITELLLTAGHANVDRTMHAEGGQMSTALIQAVNLQREEVTALLLRHGARTDIRQGRYAPLHIACLMRFQKGARLLLAAGADPFAKSTAELTPMHMATLVNNVDIISMLVPYYRSGKLNIRDIYGQTPLHYAALATSIYAVRTLVEAGADLNVLEHQGWSPLWMAAVGPPHENEDGPAVAEGIVQDLENDAQRRNRWAVVQYLVQNGARADLRDNEGEIMAQKARLMGRIGIAKFLESVDSSGLVNQRTM